MSTSNVVPAYRNQSGSTASATDATENTTVRSAILKQIRILQKQEAALGEQLAKLTGDTGTGAIQQRIALQQQIDGIEQQIKALQTALLQKNADRKIQVDKKDENPAAKATDQDSKPATTATVATAAAAAAATATAPAAPASDSSNAGSTSVDPSATVGSVVDTTA